MNCEVGIVDFLLPKEPTDQTGALGKPQNFKVVLIVVPSINQVLHYIPSEFLIDESEHVHGLDEGVNVFEIVCLPLKVNGDIREDSLYDCFIHYMPGSHDS